MTSIGDANDPATILADVDNFGDAWFPGSATDEMDTVRRSFPESDFPPRLRT
jgi:hypothetical protein